MSDSSSDEEDLSKFRDVVDNSFTKLIGASRGEVQKDEPKAKPVSERYLEVSGHYNDVKVPAEMQKRIGAKLSALIDKNVQFIDIKPNRVKKPKIKGGIKLFKDSNDFLSCEEIKDSYTETHNKESKKIKHTRRFIEGEPDNLNEDDKIQSAAVTGEYVLSKDETKSWKSRRKEKIFKYKKQGKNNLLTAIE